MPNKKKFCFYSFVIRNYESIAALIDTKSLVVYFSDLSLSLAGQLSVGMLK